MATNLGQRAWGLRSYSNTCNTKVVAYEAQIYTVIAARLTPDVQKHLDALLVAEPVVEGEEDELLLSLLRRDPGAVGVESAMNEIAKLQALRGIGLPSDLFEGYTPKLIERLRRRIAAESPSHIREHPLAIRMTLLAVVLQKIGRKEIERKDATHSFLACHSEEFVDPCNLLYHISFVHPLSLSFPQHIHDLKTL